MKHINAISRGPAAASAGTTNAIETIIILLLTVLFRDWDNYAVVIQNLQTYYAKTP